MLVFEVQIDQALACNNVHAVSFRPLADDLLPRFELRSL